MIPRPYRGQGTLPSLNANAFISGPTLSFPLTVTLKRDETVQPLLYYLQQWGNYLSSLPAHSCCNNRLLVNSSLYRVNIFLRCCGIRYGGHVAGNNVELHHGIVQQRPHSPWAWPRRCRQLQTPEPYLIFPAKPDPSATHPH